MTKEEFEALPLSEKLLNAKARAYELHVIKANILAELDYLEKIIATGANQEEPPTEG